MRTAALALHVWPPYLDGWACPLLLRQQACRRCEGFLVYMNLCSASQVWAAVDRRLGIPLNATWAMTALAFLIGLPLLHSEETFFALASISSVGLNLSCEGPLSHVQPHVQTLNPDP